MAATIVSMLLSMVTRLLTAELLEYVILMAAQAIADKTDNKYDDQLVAKIKEILQRKPKGE